jgi:phosphate transport system substrate-binding protein
MMKSNRWRDIFRKSVSAIAFVATYLAGIGIAHAGEVIVQGATTFTSRLLIPHQNDIESLSGHKLVIFPNKSSLGLLALFEGRAELAMISSSLDSELLVLRKSHPNFPFHRLHSFEVSRVRAAFAVHSSNPVRSITPDHIRRVLQGEITNWRDLGGPDLPIRLVIVREGGGVQASVERELLGGKQIEAKNAIRVQIGTQVVKVVEQERGALGLAQLGNLRLGKAAELDIGEPVFQILKFVSLDEPSPKVKDVIDATRKIAELKLTD